MRSSSTTWPGTSKPRARCHDIWRWKQFRVLVLGSRRRPRPGSWKSTNPFTAFVSSDDCGSRSSGATRFAPSVGRPWTALVTMPSFAAAAGTAPSATALSGTRSTTYYERVVSQQSERRQASFPVGQRRMACPRQRRLAAQRTCGSLGAMRGLPEPSTSLSLQVCAALL